MIDRETVTLILDTAEILDVVGDFVKLKKKGQSYWGLCPFHSERSPSFSVSPSRNICKCFSCGEGGSPLNFIMKHENLEYVDALKWLANKYNIVIEEKELSQKDRERENRRQSLIIVNEFVQKFFHNQLLTTQEGLNVGMSYLNDRGISKAMIDKFYIGYSPRDRFAIQNSATSFGYSIDLLEELGLVIKYDTDNGSNIIDRFRERIIFPIFNIGGRVVGFGGRIMVSDSKRGKYINSPDSIIYNKSNELYGIYQAKKAIAKLDKVYFVEGYLDVVSMHQSGIENVVAGSGTALSKYQIGLIQRFTKNITLLYDGDKAGIKAAIRGVDLLLEHDMNIKIVVLPEGEDPDSFARKNTSEELSTFISQNEIDFITFKVNILKQEVENDPLKKTNLIIDIIYSISLIPDNIKKTLYIKTLAEQLSIEETILAKELTNIQRNDHGYDKERFFNTQYQNASIQISVDKSFWGFKKFEVELAKLIIVYGKSFVYTVISYDHNDNPIYDYTYLVYFINSEILNYDIEPSLSDNFRYLLKEILSFVEYGNANDSLSLFLNHYNDSFRNLANSIDVNAYNDEYNKGISIIDDNTFDRYKYEKSITLLNRANKELNTIKMYIVIDLLKKAQRDLQDPNVLADNDRIAKILKEIAELNDIKSKLSQSLGEWTIMG